MADIYLRPNEHRGKAAVITLWVLIVMYVGMFVANLNQYRLYNAFLAGMPVDPTAAQRAVIYSRLIAAMLTSAAIFALVMLIRWFRRAFYNLQVLVPILEFNDADAAWPWFVPIVNAFRPFQVMKELHRQTAAYLWHQTKAKHPVSMPVLRWWWAFWLLNIVTGQISGYVARHATTPQEWHTTLIIAMACVLISVPMALLSILVIQGYVEMERLLPAAILKKDTDAALDTITAVSDASGNTPEFPPA